MAKDFSKKVELAANAAILIVAVIFGYILVQKYFFTPPTLDTAPKEIAKGTKLAVPETDFQANGKTLLVVLQKGCKYCTESMPFYKDLLEKTPAKGVKMVAVLPGSFEESSIYLKDNGLMIPDIRQAALNSVNVRGTPTLILVDDKGEVSKSWVGKLPSEKEKEVIDQL
jgi:thioredoxin-related protein